MIKPSKCGIRGRAAVNVEAHEETVTGCSYDAFSNLLVTVSQTALSSAGTCDGQAEEGSSVQQELLTSHSTSLRHAL